jgi:DNA-binding PadR family transcriptional regulator
MFGNAIYATGEGRGYASDRLDFHAVLHAMSGRRGGPGGGGDQGDGPGHGPGRHARHRHHGGPRGGFGGPFGFGPFGFGPGGGPRGRGRKARRGDIRTAALLLLLEEPRNGYQIMQEVQERSDGVWRPSPGSVYPALQQLEDEGLIRSEEQDGRKAFQLTDAGRAHIEERDPERPAPWEEMSGDFSPPVAELAKIWREVTVAFMQVMHGSDAQLGEARKVLTTTRKDLYRILADGDPETAASDAEVE